MAAQLSEVFGRPLDFQILSAPSAPTEREGALLSALHDLLSRVEAMDAFQRPGVTDENFSEFKNAAYFVSLARQNARCLLQAAGRLP